MKNYFFVSLPLQYSRDSFDRFGDDLCELLLSHLTIEEKFRYECVAKQFSRLIFNRQRSSTLTVCQYYITVQCFKTKLLNYYVKISLNYIETVLRKCGKGLQCL